MFCSRVAPDSALGIAAGLVGELAPWLPQDTLNILTAMRLCIILPWLDSSNKTLKITALASGFQVQLSERPFVSIFFYAPYTGQNNTLH